MLYSWAMRCMLYACLHKFAGVKAVGIEHWWNWPLVGKQLEIALRNAINNANEIFFCSSNDHHEVRKMFHLWLMISMDWPKTTTFNSITNLLKMSQKYGQVWLKMNFLQAFNWHTSTAVWKWWPHCKQIILWANV